MQTGGVFDRFGLNVYNTNPQSGLRAFPFAYFDDAIESSQGIVEEVPDLSHWYEKIDEGRMQRIEELVAEGMSIGEVCETINMGVRKERKKISDETVKTYLKVLYERRMR